MIKKIKRAFVPVQVKRTVFQKFQITQGLGRAVDGVLFGSGVNIDACDGVLKPGIGAEKFKDDIGEIPTVETTQIEQAVFLFKDMNQGSFYKEIPGIISIYGGVMRFSTEERTFSSMGTIVGYTARPLEVLKEDGTHQLFFYNSHGVWKYVEGEKITYDYCCLYKNLTSACFHQGRIFALGAKNQLYYSSPYSPDNFTEDLEYSGYIHLPLSYGMTKGIVVYKGDIYIFFEYGIIRLETAGSSRNFKMVGLSYSFGKILFGSIAVCVGNKNRIFFLTEEGLYAFDGEKVEPICQNLKFNPDSGKICRSATAFGKYFLEYTGLDGKVYSVCVDEKTDKGYYTYYMRAITGWQGRIFFINNSFVMELKEGKSLPDGEEAVFKIQKLNLPGEGEKVIRKICLFGTGRVEIKIGNGKKEKSFNVEMFDGEAELPAKLKGKDFILQIKLFEDSKIYRVEFETEELKRQVTEK